MPIQAIGLWENFMTVVISSEVLVFWLVAKLLRLKGSRSHVF